MNPALPIGSQQKVSRTGIWCFLLSLLFVFSITADYRVPIGGLLMHPFLIFLPFAIAFSGIDLLALPRRVIMPLIGFFVIFSIACLQNSDPLFEIIKVGASLLVFLFFSSAVKTERDFQWISWGLLVVAVHIGILGFLKGREGELGDGSRLQGINVLEGLGNKNAQSLYTLPGLFFGTNLLIQYFKSKKWLLVGVISASIFFIIVDIFLSANRSGWVGFATIFLCFVIYSGFRLRTVIVAAVLITFAYLAVDMYANDIFAHKKKQTEEGFSSDIGRRILIRESIMVGLENPLLGVGYEELHRQMATRLGITRFGRTKIDTHFLIGYIFGSTGFFSLLCLILFFVNLPTNYLAGHKVPHYVRSKIATVRILLLSFIALYVLRSFFTREILYSPTFMGGLGLIYGYYLMYIRLALPRLNLN